MGLSKQDIPVLTEVNLTPQSKEYFFASIPDFLLFLQPLFLRDLLLRIYFIARERYANYTNDSEQKRKQLLEFGKDERLSYQVEVRFQLRGVASRVHIDVIYGSLLRYSFIHIH